MDGTGDVDARLIACLQSDRTRAERARKAAEVIRRYGGFDWVGLYDVLPDVITAIAWSGADAPAYPSFPRAQGLNGAAVSSRASVIANDISLDPRYLTTFARTGAEMVVPVVDGTEVIGTLDVESARIGAFGPAEQKWVIRCAGLLRPLWR